LNKSKEGKCFPRARICGFRGFFPDVELHPNGENDMEQVVNGGNPSSFESDLFTFTTDARMEKLCQLQSSEHEIEALFWLKEVSSQWRVKGKAFAIGNPRGECNEGERVARAAIQKELRLKPGANPASAGWTFEHAVTKYFANHSPVMRGTTLQV
jgi:pyridoxamine 5'-phosphate oxidase